MEVMQWKDQRKRFTPIWDAMIDLMIAKPGVTHAELALHIGRRPSTVGMIVNSDMFKARYNARRNEFNLIHDVAIMDKTARIAHASLDAVLGVLEKKKDTLPLATLQSVSESALSRLGYGVNPQQSAGVHVNVQQNNHHTTVIAPVSRSDLDEARMAYRQVQEMRRSGTTIDVVANPVLPKPEAEPAKSEEEGAVAPANLST